MANTWFRMYSDFLNDPKIISLAFEDQRHFIAILALKSDGAIDQDCDIKLLDRIVAQRLWVDFAIISDVKKRLVDSGLIDFFWQPIAWDKRQYVSDSSAERTRKYREKIKNRNETSQERHSDALDTDTDTYTDTDIKKHLVKKSDQIRENLPEVTDQTFTDFLQLRKAKKSPLSIRAIENIRSEAEKAGISLETALIECCARGWVGFKAEWYMKTQIQNARASPPDRDEFNKRQTEIAKQKLFGISSKNEKDITHEARAL